MQTTRQARLQATAQQAAADAQTRATTPTRPAQGLQASVTPKTPGATFGQRAGAAGATVLTVVCLLGGVLGLAEHYTDASPAAGVLAQQAGSERRAG